MAAAWACEMTALEKPWHPTSSSRQDRCRAGRRCRSWPAECARCAGCRPRRPLPGSRTRTNPRLRNPVPPSAACEKTCPTTQRRPGGFRKSPARALPPPRSWRRSACIPGKPPKPAWRGANGCCSGRSLRSCCQSAWLARNSPGLPGTAATGCPPGWLRTRRFDQHAPPEHKAAQIEPGEVSFQLAVLQQPLGAGVGAKPLHRRTIQCLFLNGLLRRELGEIPIHTVSPLTATSAKAAPAGMDTGSTAPAGKFYPPAIPCRQWQFPAVS